jgi:putative oxidoreductase
MAQLLAAANTPHPSSTSPRLMIRADDGDPKTNVTVMHRLFPAFVGGPGAVGLLFIRLVAGSALALYGWPKIQHAFSWMGDKAQVPVALQALAALAEFGGGICWILGVLTPIFSFLILCTMATAVVRCTSLRDTRSSPVRRAARLLKTAVVYLAIAVALLLAGPGRLSLDAALFGRRRHPLSDGARDKMRRVCISDSRLDEVSHDSPWSSAKWRRRTRQRRALA